MTMRSRHFLMLIAGVLIAINSLSQAALAEPGKQAVQKNQRTLLKVPYQNREHLLHVMRNNLANMGKLIHAMSEDDFTAVEAIANKMSLNEKKAQGLARRGNPAFTAMGLQFHGKDALALKDAAKSKDRKRTLRAMSSMVSTCVACHATFRVMEWPDNKLYTLPKPTPLVLPEGVVIRSK